jgi:hypothetical protein
MTYLYPCQLNTYIYDIFYSYGSIIIIAPFEIVFDIFLIDNGSNYSFELIKDPHRHTLIYKLISDYKSNITLSINNTNYDIQLKKYIDLKDKIIMSTIVKDEDAYIKQWINYHTLLGIDVFIIYDNSENNTLADILKKYILQSRVILIKWPYPYILRKSGISGQTTQQNHSLYAFRNAKYIGFFDIDEYINPQGKQFNIDILLKMYIDSKKINIQEIGSLRLLNKFFYNPNNKPTDKYNFLNIYNCNTITKSGNEKNFVIPRNVYVFSVHMITYGKKTHTVEPNELYFNHYIFLNKTNRGRDITPYTDDSIKNKVNSIAP